MTFPSTTETPDREDAVRRTLRAERSAAEAGLKDLESQLWALRTAAVESNRDDEHDPEGSTIAFEAAQLESLLERAEEHLVGVGRALDRLDAGRYGVCAYCKRPIGEARLAALPATEWCVQCASGRRR